MSSASVASARIEGKETKQWVIRTHIKNHLDEFFAIWLLICFGEEFFLGIKNAVVEFFENTIMEKSPEELEKEGVLCVGIGGGRFDEHSSLSKKRKEEECASSLVMKFLGIADDPVFEEFAKFVKNRDLKITGSKYDLAGLVKTMYYRKDTDDMKVWQWVMLILEAIYDESKEFFADARHDFEKAEVREVEGTKRKIRIVIGKSDSTQFGRFCRSMRGCRADVVIQKNSRCNVQIFSGGSFQKNLRGDLTDVARAIRVEEQRFASRVVTTDWKVLGNDEKVAGAENWYFHPERNMLLNGSLSIDQPPTVLSLERISDIVSIAISTGFAPERETQCKAGRCTSTPSNPCPWYRLGLTRCHDIRCDQARRLNGR